MIPRVIHQVWLGEDQPEPSARMEEASRSWREFHPEWEYRLWRRTDVVALFAQRRPDLLPLFEGYRHWVERADAARYLILHEHGGVYVDHDIVAVASLEVLVGESLVLAPTRPFGVSNDFVMASPGHPVLRQALDGLPAAAARWNRTWVPPYARIMFGTGPVFLTGVWRRSEETARLLTQAEYGHGDLAQALVRHEAGSTWHGWDGRLVTLAWNHPWVGAIVAACALGALTYSLTR